MGSWSWKARARPGGSRHRANILSPKVKMLRTLWSGTLVAIIGSLSFAFTVGRVDMFSLASQTSRALQKVILCIFLSKFDEIFDEVIFDWCIFKGRFQVCNRVGLWIMIVVVRHIWSIVFIFHVYLWYLDLTLTSDLFLYIYALEDYDGGGGWCMVHCLNGWAEGLPHFCTVSYFHISYVQYSKLIINAKFIFIFPTIFKAHCNSNDKF